MPILQVTTKAATQIWATPDGQRKLYELQLDYEGKPVTGKTYSGVIATVGWSGEVEIYEKAGKNGLEAFVRQAPKEGGYSGGSSSQTSTPGSRSSPYQGKDEKAIKAMWAIGQAVRFVTDHEGPEPELMSEIEAKAQDLFLMVDRVKAVTDAPVQTELDEVAPVTPEELEKINEIFEKKE